MSPTAQILFAVIGTGIATITLLITVIGFMWKSIDQRFKDLEKIFDARLEIIHVEIKQIATPQIVRP